MKKLFKLTKNPEFKQKGYGIINKCNLNASLSEFCAQKGSRLSLSMTTSSLAGQRADTPRAQTMSHVNKTVAAAGH